MVPKNAQFKYPLWRMSEDKDPGEFPTLRKFVAMVTGLVVFASAVSLVLGPGAGRRFGYQLMTMHSAGLSWFLILVLLTVTGVPLATFVMREQLYMWNKRQMRFEPFDRDEQPLTWWLLLWGELVLFVVLMVLLFIARIPPPVR